MYDVESVMNNLSDTDNNTVEIEEEIVLAPVHFNKVEDVSTKFYLREPLL